MAKKTDEAPAVTADNLKAVAAWLKAKAESDGMTLPNALANAASLLESLAEEA